MTYAAAIWLLQCVRSFVAHTVLGAPVRIMVSCEIQIFRTDAHLKVVEQ